MVLWNVYEDWRDEKGSLNQAYYDRFVEAINDDLDTPKAIAIMWELVKDDSVPAGEKKITVQEFDAVLGIGLSLDPEEGLRALGQIDEADIPEDVKTLMHAREAARVAQNWAESDRLRDQITILGYTLEDTPEGPKLSKNQ